MAHENGSDSDVKPYMFEPQASLLQGLSLVASDEEEEVLRDLRESADESDNESTQQVIPK